MRKAFNANIYPVFDWMQKLFKIWLSIIFIIAIIATFIIGIESVFFGFLLLPIIIVTSLILILGYASKKQMN